MPNSEIIAEDHWQPIFHHLESPNLATYSSKVWSPSLLGAADTLYVSNLSTIDAYDYQYRKSNSASTIE